MIIKNVTGFEYSNENYDLNNILLFYLILKLETRLDKYFLSSAENVFNIKVKTT